MDFFHVVCEMPERNSIIPMSYEIKSEKEQMTRETRTLGLRDGL